MTPGSIFETARLRARPFTHDDLGAFVAYRQGPDVERYQSWTGYTTEQGARSLIASMQGLRLGVPGEWCQIALEKREGRTLVGDLALKVDASETARSRGRLHPRADRAGQGLRHRSAACAPGLPVRDDDLHRVIAVTDALNEPAAALLERIGMRREAHFVESVFFKGAWGSEFLFAMLHREWASTA